MTVAVDICNAALIKLAQEPIEDLSDDVKSARICKARYQTVLESVLRDSLWNFAIKREVLPQSTEELNFGEGNVHELPQDCVRLIRVGQYPAVDGNAREYYKIEGRKLITFFQQGVEANIMYVSSNIPEEFFDASFKEAVATRLAVEICYSITQSSSLKEQLRQEYREMVGDSRSINSQEITPDNFVFDEFTSARRRGAHGQVRIDPDFF